MAADLPAGEQPAWLESQCPHDAELRAEVLSLLRYDSSCDLDAFHAGAASVFEDDSAEGRMLGPYRIEREIGRGGMAVVYVAVRADGEYQKRVAIKLIKRGMDTAAVIQRLRRERRILAGLEHPSIARLLDGGTTSDGLPWIAMEYIEGLPIDRYCIEHQLGIDERCRLMEKVCDAVACAHRSLVVHRDLKPSNILVAPDGNPKLLDFGIARLIGDEDGEGAEPLTVGVWRPFTPEYASPEQIQRGPVSTASDVYSLGVVLYELLAGERPYRATRSNLQELEQAICLTDPPPPSKAEKLQGRTRRRLAGDLDNIVLMALRRDVARRYRSVEQLADDIRRHLQGLPVQARRDTLLYRGGKFLRRNRVAALGGFLVAASLMAGAIVAGREALAARERFDQFRGFARNVLVDLHAQLSDIPGTAKARQTLVASVDDYLKRVAAQHAGDDAALATEFATTYLRLGEMQGATPEAIASFDSGRLLLERRRRSAPLSLADSLVLARLRVREGSALIDLGRITEGVDYLTSGARLAGDRGQSAGWNPEAQLVKAFADWRLARLYRMQYRLDEAEERTRAAIAGSEEILHHGVRTKEVYEVLAGAGNLLGGVLRRQGHWREGMDAYKKVLADTEQRARAEPGSAGLQRELARSHQVLGDTVSRVPGHDENEVRYHVRQAIAISERLAALDPWDRTAQSELAQYLSSGAETIDRPEDRSEALGYLRRALPILQTLLKSEPGNSVLRVYAANTEADLGESSAGGKPNPEAILWLRRGMSDMASLVESDPRNATYMVELIKIQRFLFLSLARSGNRREAVALALDGIAKAQSVAGDARATPESWRQLPRAYAAMANTYRILGNPEDSRKWYRVASAEWDKLGSKGASLPDAEDEIREARQRGYGSGK